LPEKAAKAPIPAQMNVENWLLFNANWHEIGMARLA
jgi:hypothetical protein